MVFTLGHKFQVADADYTERLDWYDAKYVFSNFGGGWRLPTKEELRGMYEFLHLKGKGNFSNTRYWSSSEYDAENAWSFGFDDGQAYGYYGKNVYGSKTYYTNQVRAVRALP
jgi:hypothetical protein